jgi:putative two-component system response regulator
MSEKQRILLVDDTPVNIRILNELLHDAYQISVATNGPDALRLASQYSPDLILLDIMMPGMDGYEVCRQLKADEATRNIPVIFVTAMDEVEDEARGLKIGAVDYLIKPLQPAIVLARVHTHMKLHLYHEKLEELVDQRTQQVQEGYRDTILRLTLASEFKDEKTGAHIKRISYYTHEVASRLGMDSDFINCIYYASPMHDLGKVAIPDAILLKQGPLSEEEWQVMKSHPEIGARILEGSQSPYLQMGIDIARYHHERWDGGGYPNGIKGEEIPLTARIMNIADQYDALRSVRPYKAGFDAEETFNIITRGDGRTMPGHFDPVILDAFKAVAGKFDQIFNSYQVNPFCERTSDKKIPCLRVPF